METEGDGREVTNERASEIERRTQPGKEEVGKLKAAAHRPRTQRKNILTASTTKQVRPRKTFSISELSLPEGRVNKLPRYCPESVGFHTQRTDPPSPSTSRTRNASRLPAAGRKINFYHIGFDGKAAGRLTCVGFRQECKEAGLLRSTCQFHAQRRKNCAQKIQNTPGRQLLKGAEQSCGQSAECFLSKIQSAK